MEERLKEVWGLKQGLSTFSWTKWKVGLKGKDYYIDQGYFSRKKLTKDVFTLIISTIMYQIL